MMPCSSGHGSQGVEALACRRSFYIDAVRFGRIIRDLSLGEEEARFRWWATT